MDLVTSQAMDSLNLAMSLMGGGAVPEQPDLQLTVMKVEQIIPLVWYCCMPFFCAGLYFAGYDHDHNIFWNGALDYHLPAEEQHWSDLKEQVHSSSELDGNPDMQF